MLLSLLAAVSIQSAPPLDTPGIVLVLSGDTAFLAPTKSIDREGLVRRATLVEIYPLGSEGWEIVRRDSDLEFDCMEPRVRVIAGRDSDAGGRVRSSDQPELAEWVPIDEGYPPLALLHGVACSDMDLSGSSYESLEAELPRLRARLR